MTQEEVIELLERHGAIIRNSHLVYTSGRHGSTYINKDAIYPHTGAVSKLCEELASIAVGLDVEVVAAPAVGLDVEVVAAPAVGGVILSQWTAHHLGCGTLSVYAERGEGVGFELRRGYDRLVRGRRVLVVEDVVTTGGSLGAVIRAVADAGGDVVRVAAMVNRGGVTARDVGSQTGLLSLATVDMESYAAADCPLCRAGVPINVEVGKGREFLARKDAANG
jgi:orotate phosphoribosyltransferase